MNPLWWDRLEELFEKASKIPRSELDGFMEREAGDDAELRAELSTLLAAASGAAGHLAALREELLGFDVQRILGTPADELPDPWIGRTVSHYEILHRIGGGGMGVVYRARDIRLDRCVALKFIAPQISLDAGAKRRFVYEARAASALDHQNICTIHEIAETEDGRLFIAMAAYEGETLRTRIERGPFSEEHALDIAEQVAQALAAAHERGIAHGDVKPDNVLITRDSVVKLLDFGLARTGDGPISEAGVVQGTVAYMSPEQTAGHRADERSDVWAVGVILFEMLAGARPFAAPDARTAMHLIVTGEPDLHAKCPDLATGIIELVHKALSKDPASRFANGGDILAALRACRTRTALPVERRRKRVSLNFRTGAAFGLLTAATIVASVMATRGPKRGMAAEGGLTPLPAVAIMPFVDVDRGLAVTQLGRDLADQVRSTLAYVPGLDVMADVTPFAGARPSARRRIGQSTAPGAIVSGAVRRERDRVLVTVRLSDSRTGDSLWTGSWDRPAGDSAALRDELSLVIADTLRLRIVPYQPKTYTESRRAYDRFLQGVYAHRRYTSEDIWRALQFYREAYEEDPHFALAHAIAGNAYLDLTNLGLSTEIGFVRAREHVLQALALDSTIAEGHAALGFLQIWSDRDFVSGERSLRRTIMLYPTLPQARGWYGWYALYVRGWRDAAVANVRRALDLDPLNTARSHMIERVLYRARRYDEVLAQNQVTWSLDANVARSLRDSPLADAYREQGRYEEAIAEFQSLQERTGAPPPAGLAVTYARMGRVDEARTILREVETRAGAAAATAIDVARIHASLGDFDRAFEWLDRTYQARPYTLLSIRSDPALDTLRSDPRFDELVRRLELPPY